MWDVLQKLAFHRCRDYFDFGVIFTWFAMALGPILMTFSGLETDLKFHDVRWLSGKGPELSTAGQMMVFGTGPGPHSISQTVGVAIQHAKYIMKHAGMKGYEKAGCKLRKYEKSRL